MRFILAAILLAAPQISYAECADLTPLTQGQPVPCDGVHIKSSAVAKLIVDKQTAEQQCQNRIDAQKEISNVTCQGDLAKKDNEIQGLKDIHKIKEDIKDKQIDFLIGRLDKVHSTRTGWWYAGGVMSGIVLTMASAWALNQIK